MVALIPTWKLFARQMRFKPVQEGVRPGDEDLRHYRYSARCG
jgi:hypothetical protein